MNAKISVFVICIEAIIYFLYNLYNYIRNNYIYIIYTLYNLHDCNFNYVKLGSSYFSRRLVFDRKNL